MELDNCGRAASCLGEVALSAMMAAVGNVWSAGRGRRGEETGQTEAVIDSGLQ